MNKKFISVFLLLCLLAGYENANAAIKLPGLIGDHMILQRDTKIPVWGWATKNSEIELKFNNKIYKTKTGNDGKWIIRLKPLKAGGPYDMNIKGDGSRVCVIDPYHVISQILHSGNCRLTDKKIHQNAGDCHKQCGDQCQTPLKR